MSAIAAVLHLDGRPVEPEVITKITEAMAANGPDRRDVWVDGAVGLGCASFYTVPEQLHEPMPLVAPGRALVLDGRIDNRAELRWECAARKVTVAHDAGDGAFVIAAYDAWGLDAPAHLVGEWAFVLWDRVEERLIAARDHIARRSLRWWADGRTLIVSSQFPGILEHPDVRAEPNEEMVAEWIAGAPATIDETLWAGIRNVPGGRLLVSSRRGTPQVRRYWDPAAEKEEPVTSLTEAADAMRAAVTEAVRAQLRCIGTPEIELSGGWDSSTVALVADELHDAGDGPDFRLSSAVFPDDALIDETPYIEAMERHLGRMSIKRPHEPASFDVLVNDMEETRHPWRRDDWRAVRASSAHRVTLTGDGGNETLGGMWPSAPALLTDAILMRRAQPAGARELLARLVRPHVRPSLPLPVRVARSPPLGEWLDRDFSRRVSLRRRIVVGEPTARFTTRRRIDILSWLNGWGTQQSDLNTELDRGRFVELRQPLHDVRLVRLALRVPARVIGSPQTDARHLHRRAYGASLPAVVIGRTWGTEFTSLRVLELRRLVQGLGEPRTLESKGWVDAAPCRTLVESALSGSSVHWRASLLYSVELWIRSQLPR